jgi:hypothetical protein
MAPEGPKGRKNIGLRREDAARDRMKEFGFKKPVINASIKQVLKVCSLVLEFSICPC